MSNVAFAQKNNAIDSLKTVNFKNADNTEALWELIDYYKTEDLDSLNHYADILLKKSNAKKNGVLINKISLIRANGYLVFNRQIQADSIIKALIIDEPSNAKNHIEYLLTQGRILKFKAQYDKALAKFYHAIQLVKDYNLTKLLPYTYAEVASILKENNDLENGVKYYGYALKEANSTKNIELQIDVCYALCRAYNGGFTVNLDSSIYYGELGLNIAKKAQYESGYAKMLFIVAAPIIRNGEYRKGLNMSREALRYADKYSFSTKKKYFLVNNQGFAYEKLGLYDSAWLMMEEGERLRPVGIDLWRLRYLILKSKGDYRNALTALETYKVKRDSILEKRSASKLSTVQARYEADLQEREVVKLTQRSKLQSLELSQQQYLFVAIILLFVFLIVAGILLYWQKRLKQQQIRTKLELEETHKRLDIEKQYRESEIKALRSQMNPHFIFNALNSIQEYIMSNEKKLAGKYLGKFADLMRIYLEHSKTKTITVNEEIETLNLYLELEKLRFEDSLECSVTVDKNVDAHLIAIPTLLVQPYVENAIKHGLLHKKKDRKLHVLFACVDEGKMLQCEIRDNGVGRLRAEEINKMRNPTHKSFATSATKSRLDLLNHTKERMISVETIDLLGEQEKPIGTKIIIKIPI